MYRPPYTKVLLFAFLSGNFLACQKTISDPEQDTIVEGNIALAQRSFEAFNQHDWVKHASYFSDACSYLDPSYGTAYKVMDRKGKQAKYEQMEAWSPDIKDSITTIFGAGDKVLVEFISSGTAMTDSTEQKWSLPICCVFTMKDGLIMVDETYYDRGR